MPTWLGDKGKAIGQCVKTMKDRDFIQYKQIDLVVQPHDLDRLDEIRKPVLTFVVSDDMVQARSEEQ